MNWKLWFRNLLADEYLNLRWLMLGASVFFCGSGLVFFSEYYVANSLRKEIAALAGMALIGLGGLTAITAYLLIIISRLGLFPNDDD